MAEVKLESVAEKQIRLFREFIQKKKVVIVDSQGYTRAALAGTLAELGAPAANLMLTSNYEDAKAAIATSPPDLLFAEYDLERGRCGLDLLVEQRKAGADTKKSLFFLVTGNNSQAAVAKAAEEDVDGYILKPYTLDGLRNAIMRHALLKAYPSDYTKTIDAGKRLLEEKNFDEALAIFEKAMPLDPKPSLAHFYHGQAELLKKTLANAEKDYAKGLDFNKIHYKCLVGMFDLLMEQKRTKDAYEVVRKIARYFPANPDRLATVLRLAVMNGAYEDIERYYQLFCNLDQRNEVLVRYICAALVVCGKYYLQTRQPARAIELFSKAKTSGLGRPKVLREIITSLIQYDLQAEAAMFLQSYPAELLSSLEFQALQYVVRESSVELGASVAQGRDLLQKGIKDPLLHQIMIERSVQAGFNDHAQTLYAEACGLWPESKKDFDQSLNKPKIRVI